MENEKKIFNYSYEVYPDAEKLGIGVNKLVAIFKYREHAKEFSKKYGGYYIIKKVKNTHFDKQ